MAALDKVKLLFLPYCPSDIYQINRRGQCHRFDSQNFARGKVFASKPVSIKIFLELISFAFSWRVAGGKRPASDQLTFKTLQFFIVDI